MTNQKHDDPLTPVRSTMRTTVPVREIGMRDRTHIQWFHRFIAYLFPEKPKPSPDCSDAEGKAALTPGEQIYVGFKLEGMDHGYGFYQQPSGHRANDPLDQLLGPVEKEVKDRKPDKPGETWRKLK